MESGVFPQADHRREAFPPSTHRAKRAGEPLAGGWFCTFHAWTGDLKEKVLEHRVERSYLA
eukprot:12142282-Alexandrium_andersonii.AAC.1